MTEEIKVVCCRNNEEKPEPFYKQAWRPIAAMVYLAICLFDFIIMPSIIEYNNKKINTVETVTQSLRFTSPATRQSVMIALSNKGEWHPRTLEGGGMFHLAFGALLGAAAFTRGQEKVQKAKNGS